MIEVILFMSDDRTSLGKYHQDIDLVYIERDPLLQLDRSRLSAVIAAGLVSLLNQHS